MTDVYRGERNLRIFRTDKVALSLELEADGGDSDEWHKQSEEVKVKITLGALGRSTIVLQPVLDQSINLNIILSILWRSAG